MKRRKIFANDKTKRGAGLFIFGFCNVLGTRGVGATLYPNIYNVFFCDIRVLIRYSNRLVSHCCVNHYFNM